MEKLRFGQGEACPDWLLSLDPMGPAAIKGVISFDTPCEVLEDEDCYWVFPIIVGRVHSVMSASGEGSRIVATGKQVRVCLGSVVITGDIFGTMQSDQAMGQRQLTAPAVNALGHSPSAEQEVRQRGFFGVTWRKLGYWLGYAAALNVLLLVLIAVAIGDLKLLARWN